MAKAPSVLPSLTTEPRSPAWMWAWLVATGCGISLVLWLFTIFAAPFVLALSGVDDRAVLRLALAQAAVGVPSLLVICLVGVQRMRPMYRVLLRGPRLAPRTPPSPSAVCAAFRFPERGAAAQCAVAQLVPLLDLLSIYPVSGLEGWSRLTVSLLPMLVAIAGYHPIALLWKRITWQWLGRLHPDDVALPPQRQLRHRFALTVAMPVGAMGVAALLVLGSHLIAARARASAHLAAELGSELDLTAACVAAVLVALCTALALRAARFHGAILANDLSALSGHVEQLQHAPVELPGASSLPDTMHTELGKDVARALEALNERFAHMRAQERQALRAVEDVQQMKSQFLASMSHDLRSPLNSILGFTHLIESGSEGPLTREQRESLHMISSSARDLLRLVTNVLDSARLEAGRLELRRAWTPSVEILTQAVAEGRRMIGDRPLEIEAELEPGLPPVYADADRVVQAVVGLFSHAIDAMERGSIRLVARVGRGPPGPARHLRVDVVDQGAGIREADKETLFQAFREVQEPSGRRIGGLGLGLSVARELVRAHGGDIWFATAAGKGTTFTVAIPLDGPGASPRHSGRW